LRRNIVIGFVVHILYKEKLKYNKFYNLQDLNNHLEKIDENETEINKKLLTFYNYESKILTEEDIINSFINDK
jgi:hypothetical protein